ncbi:hypothetical protein HG530_013859 [Fusarium avenaceum]|nr:hypothetical protein HG530_013859 [Fusarium avenaceum]
MDNLQRAGEESMEDVFLQQDLGPTIAEHATQCQSLFNKYIVMPEIVPDPTIMDDQLARFSVWASNMDVYGPPNVSLDYRLRFSPTAADIIHQLLDIICDTLLSLKPVDERPPQTSSRKRQRISVHGDSGTTRTADDDASDSESVMDPAEENVVNITEIIGGTLTRLFRLSNAVRKSAKANRARKIEMYTDDEEANKAIEELRLYTKCYIEFRFPEAPETLRSALVEANALRLRRLCYQQSHRRRIDFSIQNPKTTPAVVELPKMTERALTVRFAPSELPKPTTTSNMAAPSPVPVTNATTARQTAVAALYAKSTTEVPRAKSVLVNNKLSFPPIPPTQQCPYCGVIIEFKNTPKSLLWQAPSHDPIVFGQEIHYREHSIKEHGVPEAYATALSDAARRPVLDKVLECPFGDDFQPPEKAGSSFVFSTEALQAHVAGHMKEIALLTLQKLPSHDVENMENVDSDQPLEDDGPTGPYGITRASMCSVLEDELLDFQDNNIDVADGNVGRREEEISAGVTVLNLEDKDDLGMTELHHAVQAGDLGLVETLIYSGTGVNPRDENGQTPLHYAAERNFIDCMKVLVSHGADSGIVDNSGFSPSIWAVIAGQEDAARQLLFGDTGVLVADADKESALTWAARLGWNSITRMIAAHGETVHGIHLQEAAASGSVTTVAMLLNYGHDPNHRNRDGWSAIHLAAEEGHPVIVRLLMEAGADPNALSSYGTSPLHCAANGGHVSIVRLLLQAEVDALKSTCHGWTALHHATYMGHSDVVRVLLEDDRARASASQQDNHGWSALHLAVCRRDLATIRILMDKSIIADPQILLDESGYSAEDWLYHWTRSTLQKVKGDLAFSKSRCCRAVTGLRQAVVTGSVPMIKLLLKSGHDINSTDSGRRTALYYASKNCNLPVMDALIDLGADPNILPVGRIEWEEFISLPPVQLRLMRAGYKKPDLDNETEDQIRQEFKLRNQPSMLDQSASSLWGQSILPILDQSESHRSDQRSSYGPTLPMHHTDLSKPTGSPAPTHQANVNKRKAGSSRRDWWKRLIGGK